MENQVLSIKQMQELKELGIDTSKASMFWHPAFYRVNGVLDYDKYEDIPRIKLENNYNLEYDIPAFTLEDILKIIELSSELIYILMDNCIFIYSCEQDVVNDIPLHKEYFDLNITMLDGCFNMLIWCLDNGYIK